MKRSQIMKPNYKIDGITAQDYADFGLTEKGIERAAKIEHLLVEAFNTILEDEDHVSPHDVTSFLRSCVDSVGLNKSTVLKWNKDKK